MTLEAMQLGSRLPVQAVATVTQVPVVWWRAPVVQCDRLLWVCPVFFLPRSSSVSSPFAPVVESSCPMTSDSRSCKDSSSVSSQNPRSTAHRPLLLLYLLSPAYTLPRPPSLKYKTALPHSSGSSHCWLAH